MGVFHPGKKSRPSGEGHCIRNQIPHMSLIEWTCILNFISVILHAYVCVHVHVHVVVCDCQRSALIIIPVVLGTLILETESLTGV